MKKLKCILKIKNKGKKSRKKKFPPPKRRKPPRSQMLRQESKIRKMSQIKQMTNNRKKEKMPKIKRCRIRKKMRKETKCHRVRRSRGLGKIISLSIEISRHQRNRRIIKSFKDLAKNERLTQLQVKIKNKLRMSR